MPEVCSFHTACPFTKKAVCRCREYAEATEPPENNLGVASLVHIMYAKANPDYEKEFGPPQYKTNA